MEEEEGEKYRMSKGSPVVCLARVGAEAEMIVRSWHWDSGTGFEMGTPLLHSLIIPGNATS